MQHREHITQQIIELMQHCTDDLLDLIHKLLVESGY